MAKLSEREIQVIERIGMGQTPTAACRAMGYKHPRHDASRLKKKPEFIAALNAQYQQNRENSEITREEVEKMCMETYELAQRLGDPGAMARVINEINKMHGFLAPKKHEHNHKLTGKVEHIRGLSDADLLKLTHRKKDDDLDVEYEIIEDDEDEDLD